MQTHCNICGGADFGPGPLGRMSHTLLPPRCRKCGSLERQRAQHAILQAIPPGLFAKRKCLQVSRDPALDPTRFAAFEVSIHGRENSLDLEKIDRPNGSYDYIAMNHVLEFVRDDRKAFTELLRILTGDGILQIGFSNALGRAETVHSDGGSGPFKHFHLFGRDVAHYFETSKLAVSILVVTAADPVTDAPETVHFFCRRAQTCDGIRRMLKIWMDDVVLG